MNEGKLIVIQKRGISGRDWRGDSIPVGPSWVA